MDGGIILNKKTLTIGFVILIAVIAVAAITAIDFDTPIADRMILKCEGDLNCYSELDTGNGFARFFTLVHADGSIEKVVLIEDYPVEIIDVKR